MKTLQSLLHVTLPDQRNKNKKKNLRENLCMKQCEVLITEWNTDFVSMEENTALAPGEAQGRGGKRINDLCFSKLFLEPLSL